MSKRLCEEEGAVEQHFTQTTRRNERGQFVVRLPLKEHPLCIGNTSIIARKQFLNLEQKLIKGVVKWIRQIFDGVLEVRAHGNNWTIQWNPTQRILHTSQCSLQKHQYNHKATSSVWCIYYMFNREVFKWLAHERPSCLTYFVFHTVAFSSPSSSPHSRYREDVPTNTDSQWRLLGTKNSLSVKANWWASRVHVENSNVWYKNCPILSHQVPGIVGEHMQWSGLSKNHPKGLLCRWFIDRSRHWWTMSWDVPKTH